MDKQEYKIKSEDIKYLIRKKEYEEAAAIADTIDWTRVRSVNMLCTISELYKANRRYEDSREVLLLAYERNPSGRNILFSLCELSLKLGDMLSAIDFYTQFTNNHGQDPGRLLLRYKILQIQEVSLEERIEVLEQYRDLDYNGKWAYELAWLYHKAGWVSRCIEECDEIFVWFRDGKYVIRSLELKQKYKPLTLEQGKVYARWFDPYAYGDGTEESARMPAEENDTAQTVEETVPVLVEDAGAYDTMNMQQELAKGLQEALLQPEEADQEDVAPSLRRGDTQVLIPLDALVAAGREGDAPAVWIWGKSAPETQVEEFEGEESLDGGRAEAEYVHAEEDLESGRAEAEYVHAEEDLERGRSEAEYVHAEEGLESGRSEAEYVHAEEGLESGRAGAEYVYAEEGLESGRSGAEYVYAEEGLESGRSGAEYVYAEEGLESGQAGAEYVHAEENLESGRSGAEYVYAEEGLESGQAEPEHSPASAAPEQWMGVAGGQNTVLAGAFPEPAPAYAEGVLSEPASFLVEGTLPMAADRHIPAGQAVQAEPSSGEAVSDLVPVLTKAGSGQKNTSLKPPALPDGDLDVQRAASAQAAGEGGGEKGQPVVIAPGVYAGLLAQDTKVWDRKDVRNIQATVEEALERNREVRSMEAAIAREELRRAAQTQPGAEQALRGAEAAKSQTEPHLPSMPLAEEQIDGQISLDDLLQDFEKNVQARSEEREAGVRRQMLESTGPLFDRFEAAMLEELSLGLGESGGGQGCYGAASGEREGFARGGEIFAQADAGEYRCEEASRDTEAGAAVEAMAEAASVGRWSEMARDTEAGTAVEAMAESGMAEAASGGRWSEMARDTEAGAVGEAMAEAGVAEAASGGRWSEMARDTEAGAAGEAMAESGMAEAASGGRGSEIARDTEAGAAVETMAEAVVAEAASGGRGSEIAWDTEAGAAGEAMAEAVSGGHGAEMARVIEAAAQDVVAVEDLPSAVDRAGSSGAVPAEAGKDASGMAAPAGDRGKEEREAGSDFQWEAKGEVSSYRLEETRQPGEKYRRFSKEERQLFGIYAPNKSAREQMVQALDCISMEGHRGNVLISGDEGMDTLALAQNVLRYIQAKGEGFIGRAGKVSGVSLQGQSIPALMEQLSGGGLLIHKAGDMREDAIEALCKALKAPQCRMVVVLEDSRRVTGRLIASYPALAELFDARIEMQALDNDALVQFAIRYAREKEYAIDEMGILALHTRIEERQSLDHAVTVPEVKELMDEAMQKANKKSLGHFFELVLGRRYDAEDMIILKEKHFSP